MDKITKKIVMNESDLIVRNILLDLIQFDKKNEERVHSIYFKYK